MQLVAMIDWFYLCSWTGQEQKHDIIISKFQNYDLLFFQMKERYVIEHEENVDTSAINSVGCC